MECLRRGSSNYPDLLAQIPDPPGILWVEGDLSILTAPAVAIVGARAASRDGMATASALASDLVRAGIAVVSGLARGIDAAAHRGALDAGGKTIAVLGTGIDVVYPAEHRELSARIASSGLLVTEYPPGAFPDVFHFPRRNRIISGLSRAVVVVEAAEKSGALITAKAAAEQGREVMAVPGSVVGPRNRGAHALLRDGAKLVEFAVDILQELGIAPTGTRPPDSSQGVEFTVDDVAAKLGIPAGDALARLLEWELTGEIQRIGSGRFVRTRDKV